MERLALSAKFGTPSFRLGGSNPLGTSSRLALSSTGDSGQFGTLLFGRECGGPSPAMYGGCNVLQAALRCSTATSMGVGLGGSGGRREIMNVAVDEAGVLEQAKMERISSPVMGVDALAPGLDSQQEFPHPVHVPFHSGPPQNPKPRCRSLADGGEAAEALDMIEDYWLPLFRTDNQYMGVVTFAQQCFWEFTDGVPAWTLRFGVEPGDRQADRPQLRRFAAAVRARFPVGAIGGRRPLPWMPRAGWRCCGAVPATCGDGGRIGFWTLTRRPGAFSAFPRSGRNGSAVRSLTSD